MSLNGNSVTALMMFSPVLPSPYPLPPNISLKDCNGVKSAHESNIATAPSFAVLAYFFALSKVDNASNASSSLALIAS